MSAFEFILILLAAVLVSNLINRFVPLLSVPIVQIILGSAIALIPFAPFAHDFELEPELIFLLFIAPLIFHTSMIADKKVMWAMRKPIISTAIVLVILTVIGAGFFVHALIPVIPLAAAFALIAACGPTDIVAVDAVAKRVTVPKKIMGIMYGESSINDASGLVCFQFAVATVTTGTFSLLQAAGQFVFMGLGGLIVGLLLTWLKSLLVQWLRTLGIENVTLHILIGILTPFIIYMVAEAITVSGILAVFAAGLAHSIFRDKFNPDTIRLTIAQESVWSVLSFAFDGLVFVLLGTQLPRILRTIGQGSFALSGWQIAGCILLLTLTITLIRFLWWILAISKKTYQDDENPIGKGKAGLIFSLAGARGTVTLASIMSIPLLLADGSAFPERDLIILLATGVIVISLLVTNFILPLLVEQRNTKARSETEQETYTEIIQKVIEQLTASTTTETRLATEIVVRSYNKRQALPQGNLTARQEARVNRDLLNQAFQWEKENTLAMLEQGLIDDASSEHFLEILNTRIQTLAREEKHGFRYKMIWFHRHLIRNRKRVMHMAHQESFTKLMTANVQYVLAKLSEMRTEENNKVVDNIVSFYEFFAASRQGRQERQTGARRAQPDESLVFEIAAKAFQIERGLIQEMFEAGRITRETAKEMRGNIDMLQTRLQADAGD